MKSGFITIIGKPNVGKSTFLNKVIGEKIAIMSPKPQTTRNIIQGIYTDSRMQVIFLDTPGIHKPKHYLGEKMVDSSFKALSGVDACFFMVDASENVGEYERLIIEKLKKIKMPVFLILNKIDLLPGRGAIDKVILDYMSLFEFKEVFPISAKEATNINHLLDRICEILPEGPQYYPDDQITDQPEKFIISELVREKVLYLTQEEIPHSIAVGDIMFKEDDGRFEVYATIFVERASQKKIIIGQNGSMIKKIGTLARKDINKFLGAHVHLELWVKVKENWRNRVSDVKNFGYFNE